MSIVGHHLTKFFAGVRVLDSVDIALNAGEVHALLGANGSGKSTLVKILTGVYQPDDGDIEARGRRLRAIASPHQAAVNGIAVVHQEAPLIDTLSVAECIAVFRGYPKTNYGRIDWPALKRESQSLLDQFQVPVSPRTLAGQLSPAERALVALVIALDRVKHGVELLILDEVTAALPEDQAQLFLQRAGKIAASGVAILMVTHRLAELRGLARSVTVLREGRVVYAAPAGELGDDGLVSHMVGPSGGAKTAAVKGSDVAIRKLWSAAGVVGAYHHSLRVEPALSVKNLRGTYLRDVTFSVQQGEIVGVAGLVEGGIAELPEVLAGVAQREGGDIRIFERSMPVAMRPGDAIDAGLAMLPADRLRNGGIATLSVADNVLLPQFDRFWGRGRREARVLDNVISVFDVRPPSARALFGKLSGGNQQKTLLGKWLLTKPSVLVLDDPTSGVDPGAREKIFEALLDAANEGVAILLFSTEPEQLASICGRVLVLRYGRVAAELSGHKLNRKTISQWCYA